MEVEEILSSTAERRAVSLKQRVEREKIQSSISNTRCTTTRDDRTCIRRRRRRRCCRITNERWNVIHNNIVLFRMIRRSVISLEENITPFVEEPIRQFRAAWLPHSLCFIFYFIFLIGLNKKSGRLSWVRRKKRGFYIRDSAYKASWHFPPWNNPSRQILYTHTHTRTHVCVDIVSTNRREMFFFFFFQSNNSKCTVTMMDYVDF